MLELFGEDYISEHIRNAWEYEQRELAYRYYMTDCVYAMTQGAMKTRFFEVLENMENAREKEQQGLSNDEIERRREEMIALINRKEVSD